MLDKFLMSAYAGQKSDEQEQKLARAMRKLPIKELYKLAFDKTAHTHSGGIEWLEKYKGTSLFEQAVQLEQESIQQELASRQQQEMSRETYDLQDQMCMKKRLLDLQLAQLEQAAVTGQPPASGASTQTPPPATPVVSPPNGATPQDAAAASAVPGGSPESPPGTPKSVTVKMSSVEIQHAIKMGQLLAQNEKRAFDVAAGFQGVMNAVKNNPGAVIGAGVGGAAGLAHGLQKDEHGNRSLLKGLGEGALGAVGGGALGHTAHSIGKDTDHLMGQGLGFGDSLQTGVTNFKDKLLSNFHGSPEEALARINAFANR